MLSTLYNLYRMTKLSGGLPQFKVVSRAIQSLSWKGSKNPEFSNNEVFLCTRNSYNSPKIMEILSARCLLIYINDVPKEQQGPDLNCEYGATTKFGETGRTVPNKIKGLISELGQLGEDAVTIFKNILKNAGLFAHLMYKVTPNFEEDNVTSNSGTITLQIGDWFKSDKLVMQNISNIVFSKEIISYFAIFKK